MEIKLYIKNLSIEDIVFLDKFMSISKFNNYKREIVEVK